MSLEEAGRRRLLIADDGKLVERPAGSGFVAQKKYRCVGRADEFWQPLHLFRERRRAKNFRSARIPCFGGRFTCTATLGMPVTHEEVQHGDADARLVQTINYKL